jgi:N-acetyl-beta-hexosaminidase
VYDVERHKNDTVPLAAASGPQDVINKNANKSWRKEVPGTPHGGLHDTATRVQTVEITPTSSLPSQTYPELEIKCFKIFAVAVDR